MTSQKCGLIFSSIAATVVVACCTQRPQAPLEVYPAYSRLRVGDQIHYTVMYRRNGAPNFVEDYSLESKDPAVVQVVDSVRLEAVSPGSAEVLVRSDVGERALSIEVEPVARPPIPATHHTEVKRIAGPEVLFVGHANLDGWDHTAVAKPGIDRLVREFKARGHPVVYFVSQDYPFWYTEDRQPDLAVVSEGQEHQIVVDAEQVVFSGGDFMVCTLRNVQMTLHGMVKAGDRQRVHFVFLADAIWTGYGDPREYPAPMTSLDRLMSERSSARERYEQLVVPFLDRVFGKFPTGGYPAVAPEPPLQDLVDGWTVEVAIDKAFVQSYRSGNPNKVMRFDFLSRSARHRLDDARLAPLGGGLFVIRTEGGPLFPSTQAEMFPPRLRKIATDTGLTVERLLGEPT